MPYVDESEYDEPPAQRSDRRTQAARPAWDAATYGRPDDTRRARDRPAPTASRAEPARGDPALSSLRLDSVDELYRADPNTAPGRPAAPHPDPPYSGSPYPDPTYPDPTYPDPIYPDSTYSDRRYPDSPHSAIVASAYPASAYPAASEAEPDDYASEPAAPGYQGEPDAASSELEFTGEAGVTSRSAAEYPGGLAADRQAANHPARTGRNLPAAIGVGVGLGAIVVASLFLWRPAFLGVIVVAVGIAIWELVRAIRAGGVDPPLIPLIAGGVLMAGLAWWGQADALVFGLVITVLAAMVWRFADGPGGYGRDVYAAALVAVYVPFLAGFAALLATAPDGHLRVIATLAAVVLSDTGGYLVGVRFGQHPLAPSVSPKKTWEGLAGSLGAGAVGGALLLALMFGVAPWWGAVFGLAVSAASVLGDLGESLLKRDLGVKDMSGLLPGHGGLMDRLDSIVFAVPMAYALLVLLAPPG